jgi:hypothetical protein
VAIRMRPLNYGTGFPVTPYGRAWAARDLAGLGARAGATPKRPRAVRRAARGSSLHLAPSLRVLKQPGYPGRFGQPRIKMFKKEFDRWEQYQGLSGHPTLSNANPRYAAWRGRMYGGLAGLGFIQTLLPLLASGAQAYGNIAAAKAGASGGGGGGGNAAKQQAKAAALQLQAAQVAAESKEGTNRTLLIAGGLVAAGLVALVVMRKK